MKREYSRFAFKSFRKTDRTTRLLLLGSLACNVLALAMPVFTMQIYDRILARHHESTLAVMAVGVIVAVMIEALMRYARTVMQEYEAARYIDRLQRLGMRRFLNADYQTASSYQSAVAQGDLTAMQRLRDVVSGQWQMALAEIPFALIFLGMILYLGGVVVLAPLVMVAFFAVAMHHISRKLAKSLIQQDVHDNARYGFMAETLHAVHTVKTLHLEHAFERRFEPHGIAGSATLQAVAAQQGKMQVLSQITAQAMAVAVICLGAPQVVAGTMSFGGLIACVLLAGRLTLPVQRLSMLWVALQEASIAGARANRLLKLPRASGIRLGSDAQPPDIHPEGVVCADASFTYAGDTAPVLTAIDLRLSLGESAAVFGLPGSGKTTLLKLMSGLLAPTSGRVIVNGYDISALVPEERAARVGYLSANATIFRGTVLENLTGFSREREEEAREVAELIGLQAAIARLAQGYATQLTGSASDVLPPGLCQRIALVRVLARKPRVLLFDQADRALDREGYHHLFSLLGKIRRKIALVLVSDDKNLLQLADRQFELRASMLYPVETRTPLHRMGGAA